MRRQRGMVEMVNAPYYGQQPAKLPENVRKGVLLGLAFILVVLCYYNLGPYIGFVPDRPDDFEIVFKYGVTAKNVLDTRDGTFTKDLIRDPSITVKLTLTERELGVIWAYIHLNDFYELEEQDPERAHAVTPVVTYVLFVHAEGYPDKEVSMNDIRFDCTPSERSFFRIAWKIRDIIKSRPEYKALPEPKGGYA